MGFIRITQRGIVFLLFIILFCIVSTSGYSFFEIANASQKPLTYQFSEKIIIPDNVTTTSFIWSFGDGIQSKDHNPVHTYAKPGKYLVQLKTDWIDKNKIPFTSTTSATLVVKSSDNPTNLQPVLKVIFISKTGCPGCAIQEPIIAEVKNATTVPIETIEIISHPEAKSKYHINFTPTTIIFRDGTEYYRFNGKVASKEQILQAIANASLSI